MSVGGTRTGRTQHQFRSIWCGCCMLCFSHPVCTFGTFVREFCCLIFHQHTPNAHNKLTAVANVVLGEFLATATVCFIFSLRLVDRHMHVEIGGTEILPSKFECLPILAVLLFEVYLKVRIDRFVNAGDPVIISTAWYRNGRLRDWVGGGGTRNRDR